ncbi:hypothetical protein CBR_g31917 [Chara braunii]|uniref:Reverse transcriptase domain-containing protein n=1 Tax=Chara braunii TaxID=69332 RepID=A0A388LG03_CHABU|nr:hypothetical protein CBR_g31917 [Chara braunii]|eukprot:GBG81245.1 hypothetical protein CBR_g31917 [Chara braunii]
MWIWQGEGDMERRRRMWTRRTRRRRSRDGGEEMDGGKRRRGRRRTSRRRRRHGRRGRAGHEKGEDTRKGRRRGGMENEEVRGGGGDNEDEEGQEEDDKQEEEEEEEEEEETKRRREEETWRMRKGKRSKQHQSVPADDEISEMKEYFRKKVQKQKMEEERREKEVELRKRREEEERKEADTIREAEAREARLEARLVRLMSAHAKTVNPAAAQGVKKKSPKSKARMLREITSYLDESEDESDKVREEAGRLVDAIERRKGKRKMVEGERRTAAIRTNATRAAPIVVEDIPDDDVRTPIAKGRKASNNAAYDEVLEFVIEMHRKLSAKKAPDRRKMCNEEGIEWTRKEAAVSELVRCRTRLVYGEMTESSQMSPLSVQGHVKVRMDDVTCVPAFLKNSRNVTSGDEVSGETIRASILQALRPWSKGRRIGVRDEDLSRCIVRRRVESMRAMKSDEVRMWSRTFENLLKVPFDRNPGATLLICPVLYMHACKLSFNWNLSFLPVQKPEAEIIEEMKRRYVEKGMTRIAGWANGGEIGQAYVMPKDKDLDRWRPISPASKDPARLAGARLGRAVRYMLSSTRNVEYFDLRATDDMRRRCEGIREEMKKVAVGMVARSYDVKDMFARLAHESVMDAVSWVIARHQHRKFVGVRVSKRGKLCMMAKNTRKSEGFVLLDFALIKEGVRFELDNTFVKSAGETLKQLLGIPMGRNSSPALACVVCARSEAVFMESLGRDRELIRGMMMVDDIAVFVGCDLTDHGSRCKTKQIFASFEDCYDRSLKLVRKDEGTNAFEFLGSRLMVEYAPIQIHVLPRTRNQQHLAESGSIRVHSMQDFDSYSKKSVKKATLFASMVRALRASTSVEATMATVTASMIEARLRGYPPEVSLAALAKFAKFSGSPWKEELSRMYPGIEKYL